MNDPSRTGQEPMQELDSLRKRVAELEKEASQRGRAEERLRECEDRFRSVFDNSLDAILITMPTGEILSANRAAQSLLGMTEEEICREGAPVLSCRTKPSLRPSRSGGERASGGGC